MRTVIDIPDTQIKILDQLSKKKKISRAQIVRQALTNYIANDVENNKSYEAAFGIRKDKKLDGLVYQTKLRDEWNSVEWLEKSTQCHPMACT